MSKEKKRVVVKVGTNVLTNKENRIVGSVMRELVRQIAILHDDGISVALVSSGSIIAGKEILRNINIEDETIRRQVYSSVGQPRLMHHYYEIVHDYGMRCAQILPTKRDFTPGKHRENLINCYEGLLSEGIIPITNEDDTVSLTMSMFSDNDELASLVAELLNADLLIILSDTDGLYTGHPDDEESEVIREVKPNDKVEKYVQSSKKTEGEGRGGMASKLKVAKYTAEKGITTYITNGKKENVIIDIINDKEVGTKFITA